MHNCEKLGFVGLCPKCKIQNAKCKIRERRTVSGVSRRNDYSMWDNDFRGVSSQNFTIKLAFVQAKGFIHFAFCILNFAFLNTPLNPNLKFSPQSRTYSPKISVLPYESTRLSPPKGGRRFCDQFPQMDLHVIPGCDHGFTAPGALKVCKTLRVFVYRKQFITSVL